MLKRFREVFCVLIVIAASQYARAEAPGVYALRGGYVHPVGAADIEGGTVIIRDGLIEAVGREIPIPADAFEIDVSGMHVYPGLFDAQTSMGLPDPAPRANPWSETPAAPRAQATPEPTSKFAAMDHAKLTSELLEARRSSGVTTVLIASNAGIFNGQSAILNLSGGEIASMVLKAPATHQISYNPRPAWTYPDSLMGVVAYIRQTLIDAKHHEAASAIYRRDPMGKQRPAPDADLDAVASLLRREVPAVFIADSETLIRRSKAIADEAGLRWILSGGRQTYRMADEIRSWNVPVLLSVNFPQPPRSTEDREAEPLRVIRDRVLSPTAPAELARRNVPFALVSGKGKPADFLKGIRKAVDNGLAETAALRAVTLTPAEILGVDRQIGSISRGKIANIVVTDGPIFNNRSKVRRIFVDGREIRIPVDDKPAESPVAAPSPVDGTWNVTVRASTGEVSMQITLRVQGSELSGTYSGDAGSGDIRNGSLSGDNVQFEITTRSQAETFDWVFNGRVTGSSIEGTVTTNLGNFPFSGSKTP